MRTTRCTAWPLVAVYRRLADSGLLFPVPPNHTMGRSKTYRDPWERPPHPPRQQNTKGGGVFVLFRGSFWICLLVVLFVYLALMARVFIKTKIVVGYVTQKSWVGGYKQKSFVYNGTRCRFPINSDDDLLLDPVVWYRACIDFQRAGILSELKLTKINHESQFPEDAYHLPLSFEKRQDLTPLYRRFYSALPLSGVIKLCIYRYLVDLLMAKKLPYGINQDLRTDVT